LAEQKELEKYYIGHKMELEKQNHRIKIIHEELENRSKRHKMELVIQNHGIWLRQK